MTTATNEPTEPRDIFLKAVSDAGLTIGYEYKTYTEEELDGRRPLDVQMRWDVTVASHGRTYEAQYFAGSAHCVYPKTMQGQPFNSWDKSEFYRGRLLGQGRFGVPRPPQPNPDDDDVFMALLQDSAMVDQYATPGEMAREFGYEDVDETLRVWEACKRTRDFFLLALGVQRYADLLNAADNYRDHW